MFFHPKNLKSENNNPWFKPWFNILLHTQSIVCATVDSRCLEYLGYITLIPMRMQIWSNESSGFLGNFSSFRNGILIGKAVHFKQYKMIGKSDYVWLMRIWIFSWFIILGERRILELDETFFMTFSQSLIS